MPRKSRMDRVYVEDNAEHPDLSARVRRAAAQAGARAGRPVTAAEWVRAAVLEQLRREAESAEQGTLDIS